MRQSTQANAPHVLAVTFEAGDNDPRVLSSDPPVDPSAAAGVAAVEGSIYLKPTATAGEAWLKTGAAATAWTQFAAGTIITDHTALSNIGDDSHATIDTHIDVFTGGARGAVYHRGASTVVALAAGTAGDVLTAAGAGSDPTWETPAAGGDMQDAYDTDPAVTVVAGTPFVNTMSAIGTTRTNAAASLLELRNTTVTTGAGDASQLSPAVVYECHAWDSNGAVDEKWEILQGASTIGNIAEPTVHWGAYSSEGGAAYQKLFEAVGTKLAEAERNVALRNDWGYWSLGAIVATRTLTGENSLVLSKLETQGTCWFDASVNLNGTTTVDGNFTVVGSFITLRDDIPLNFGNASNSSVDWSTADASNPVVVWGLGDTSKAIVFADRADRATDWGLSAFSDPTIVLFDATASVWGGWQCDGTDLVSVHDTSIGLRAGGAFKRTATTSITASTTQSQGQQPLTSDINIITVCANDDDVVTLPAVTAGATVRVINEGANRLQIFPASGDDLGEGVDASTAICTSATATFIGENTTDWILVSEIDGPHGHMQQNRNTTAFVISATDQHHCYHSAGITAPHADGWSFDIGGGGTSIAISTISDAGGGKINVNCGAVHNLAVGAIVSITNTGDPNYDKVHVVTDIVDTDTFSVVATFTATATGTVDEASTMTCDPGAEGDYNVIWSASMTPAGSNETFDWLLYINATEQPTSEARRKLGTGGDFAAVAWPDILSLAVGDKLSWVMQNTSSAGNVTVRNLSLILDRNHR